jgi:Mrp family chromosome partitioning ATPase
MDSIERALQKARKVEVSKAGRARPATPSFRTAARQRVYLRAPQSEQEHIPDFDYQDTLVQPGSQQVLLRNRLVAGHHMESLSDTFRVLRAQVLRGLAAVQGNTLGICSANAGEGKTLMACNLAISLAMEPNFTILLADLDLRRPRIHEYFGITVQKGLCDYLEGNAEISECLINPGLDRLVLLPIRRSILNSSELLSSRLMSSLLTEIGERYERRIVLYDLPPLLPTDDSLVILPKLDANLIVVQEGRSEAGEIQRSIGFLKDYNFIGAVLNNSVEGGIYPYY